MSRDDAVDIEVAEILRRTDEAVLVEYDGEEVWIPQSQVLEIHPDDDPPRLRITRWIAQKKGMA